MSYFSHAPTEYDLPHPTLSRNQPRFYIPDRSSYSPGGSTAPGEHLTLHSRFPSLENSGQSTPYREGLYGPSSRASVAALRHALHNYHSYTPRRNPHTPPHQLSVPRGQCPPPLSQGLDALVPRDWGVGSEPMEALVDIHRVLYRGNEEIAGSWSEQGREVQRVIDQWFEGDCGE